MIKEVNYDSIKSKATEEQQAAFKKAKEIRTLKDMVELKRGYVGDIHVSDKEKAKRRAKNRQAKAARKRNRKVS